MSNAELIILMSISQLSLVFFKHLNVRFIMAHAVTKAVSMTFLIQSTWLISTAIGVKFVWQGDVLAVVVYVLSGMLGAYLNFRVKI